MTIPRTASTCPGCGLELPAVPGAIYTGYYHTSPECWSVYTEVLGTEFGNAALFGQVHSLTVDAYAVQHAGGSHRAKSVAVHLAGLHFVLVQGKSPAAVAPLLQRLGSVVETWPVFEVPARRGQRTVLDVALADSMAEHVTLVRDWARDVWQAWAATHEAVAAFVGRELGG